jgi:hypothetical protein
MKRKGINTFIIWVIVLLIIVTLVIMVALNIVGKSTGG